jgi:Amt family ammonium transporter
MLERFRLPRAGVWVLAMTCILGLSSVSGRPAYAQDPAGSKTGVAADVQGAGGAIILSEPADPSAADYAEKKKAYDEQQAQMKAEPFATALADGVGQNRIAVNLVWLLVCGFMVMFMQAGFAMVEAGFCRKKNAAHVMMTNFMIYPIGMLGFFILGFSLMFGAAGAIGAIGGTSPLTKGVELGPMVNGIKMGLVAWNPDAIFLQKGTYDVGVFAFFLFQMVFMDTTCTIPTGAMAERWKFSAFVVYGFFISTIIYPIFGNWVWGGGWLAMLGQAFKLGNGAADFAGSSVVHMVGGFVALAGALALGPRLGKFNRDGSSNVLPAHNLPMAMIGTFILAFGWFGFNPGSMLGASGGGMLRIGIVATVTMLASASGAVCAMLFWWAKYKKPDPSMCVNGMLAGLVAITAPSGWVNAFGAIVIGAVAGVLVCVAVTAVEKAGVDDPVGAFSVHGICGAWGVLSVGLFADGTFGAGLNGVSTNVTGLFYGGGAGQLIAQCIDVVACAVWSFTVGYAFFKVQAKVMGLRSAREDELAGLDVPEMGVEAYPEDRVAHGISGVPGGVVGVPAGAVAVMEA